MVVEAVAALENAQDNMRKVLNRVRTLELAIVNAKADMARFKTYISAGVYAHRDKKCHEDVDEAIAKLSKVVP